ncbi:MAG TPA: Holliday junction branch migration protein RuvA [Mycobacteriales bacterium]|nr:Holliday junction branch migration protein RuvA [Mycobacteriales bacterium]
MIASVRGRVLATGADTAVIEVGGVGLSVQCAPAGLATLRVGDLARLSTSLVVREDSLTLYGFADDDARDLFELLQTASGVGPKLAQAMLAVLGADGVRAAVATDDLTTLTRVPGIGRKGAQRIVLELKDRIGAVPSGPISLPVPREAAWREQVGSALAGLGWSAREVEQALGAVAPDADDALAAGEEPDVAVLLKSALRLLSRA